MAPVEFPQFSQLPPELRLGIWEAAASSPSMHLFDLCLPSNPTNDDDDDDDNNDNNNNKNNRLDRAQIAFSQRETPSSRETLGRYHNFKDTVFFDAHRTTDDTQASTTATASLDPSMYRWKMSLRAACIDAYAATALSPSTTRAREPTRGPTSPPAIFDDSINTVYLPGPNRRVQYNNQTDVLHLCLSSQSQSQSRHSISELASSAPATTTTTTTTTATTTTVTTITTTVPVRSSLISSTAQDQTCALQTIPKTESTDVPTTAADTPDINEAVPGLLDAQWSDEMAATLRNARQIALDAAHTSRFVDLSGPLATEELAMLACTLHQGLEVLYLVDYCPGRCWACARPKLRAADLAQRGALYESLNSDEGDNHDQQGQVTTKRADAGRAPDMIWGVGQRYREVFDLEGLGWTDAHPAFSFGKKLGAMIRLQQQDATQTCQFQGVRVLIVEEE